MNSIQLPYQQTGYFSKLIIDYLEEKEGLKPFYNQNCNIESFATIIEQRKQFPVNRTTLVDVLTQQYKGVDISAITKTNIQLLKNENCFTITTGHQLNLFTGPLYFIYKIITTINLAKELQIKYPNNNFVPVFWMATEDHDFEEINHFNLFKKRYELAKTQNGAVGKMKLDGVEELMLELKKELGDRNEADEIIALFSKFYSSEKTYASAIKGIVNQLFGKYGLVILDGDETRLKQLFIPEFKSELLERKNHQLINFTSEKLKKLGYKPQVSPREINIFYLKKNIRERIIYEENKYKVINTTIEFSETEIIEELTNHPERFSPNAPMRCMYQEKVLPNLAYIGCGGELAYWLQLKEMFDANQISFPTLGLRNSVLFIDKGIQIRLQKLAIEPTELFQDTETLIKNQLKKSSTTILELKKEEEIVIAVFDAIAKKTETIDPSLKSFVAAELQKTLKTIQNIETRLLKAEKQKKEVTVNQIRNVKEKLFPNNGLQERHDNIISLLLANKSIIDKLIEKLNPLKKEFVILSE